MNAITEYWEKAAKEITEFNLTISKLVSEHYKSNPKAKDNTTSSDEKRS